MKFTDKLYEDTKELQSKVNTHPFVNLIKSKKYTNNLYINFNKICIHVIQKTLDESTEFNSFDSVYKEVYRDKVYDTDIFVTKNLSNLLKQCEEYPVEHAYMFYIESILTGNYFNFENPDKIIKVLKEYIDCSIINDKQNDFIRIVNESYSIILLIFDDYYKKINSSFVLT
jgi:hypothetical protein